VATSASSVGGTALRVVPEQDATPASGSRDKRDGGGASGESAPVPEKSADEPEPLDLLALAGGSAYKRLIPLGIGAAAVAAAIVWFVARR
jgi:hypothetical protein